jgi:catechol 2,3-dioxygenase-like lactoylglutathione lyase family enzyme
MTKPEMAGIAPFFIVRNVPAALAFYRDRLAFEIVFQGPDPDDTFFGIVRRGGAMIMLKDVGVEPVPNYTRDVGKRLAALGRLPRRARSGCARGRIRVARRRIYATSQGRQRWVA